MIPLSTLLTRIRGRYESESGGATVRFTDTALIGYTNEGLECLAEDTGFYERYCTVPVSNGRTYYDLRGFTPEVVVNVKSVWSSARNDYLNQVNPETFGSSWEQETQGQPTHFWTRGIYWLAVHPKCSADTGYLRVKFSGIPPRFTFTQQVLYELPDRYYVALEDYVLSVMAGADHQPKKAGSHYASYQRRAKTLHDLTDRRLVESTTGRFGRFRGR